MNRILVILFLIPVLVRGQHIQVYFNQTVNNAISAVADAQYIAHPDDSICAFIDRSQSSIDIAVWDNGSAKIVTALNNAYIRGITVRYISSSNSLNTALSGLNANIPVLERDASINTNVMHNKFIIADATRVFTGSMNFGDGSMFDDYNNFLIIEDQALAQNYLTEFNEMWGGPGPVPNTANSKFGPDKSDNTTHNFTIDAGAVELYFSPTDQTTSHIIDAINSADHTLDIAMFTFINNDLGDAVIDAKNRGVTVRAIIENVNYIGSEFNGLIDAGIIALSHSQAAYDFHHKYCIIDAGFPSSDPMVVTGSHNWTNSAEEDNDENTLIIHNHEIANEYSEEFGQRFAELTGTHTLQHFDKSGIRVSASSQSGVYSIHSDEAWQNASIEVVDIGGRIISKGILSGNCEAKIDISAQPVGLYIVRIRSKSQVASFKLSKD
ncbi:MAG TPA: phospholipase D-like domain-containing protein [Bacteroidales bacterium]|nr:phospholipase D-like domain-containing protein [Bacteroidales bacterium]HQL69959.1 phospholipase D-like domain-containing protein [Bacteroidales bacterium]